MLYALCFFCTVSQNPPPIYQSSPNLMACACFRLDPPRILSVILFYSDVLALFFTDLSPESDLLSFFGRRGNILL